jgi:hypothetical protein
MKNWNKKGKDEKGSNIEEKGRNGRKVKKINNFRIFSGRFEKWQRKRRKR